MTVSDYYLMCAPDYFTVSYIINPWMEGNINATALSAARTQWQALQRIITRHAAVELIAPQPDVPDLVFTANAGLVLGDTVVLSHFRHPERQREEPYFAEWFAAHGFAVQTMPADVPFEGAGDALFDRAQPWLWFGHGHRSVAAAGSLISAWLDVEVVPLQLVDRRFYHLDTCFCPLSGGYVLYYPPAFAAESQATIAARVAPDKLIALQEEDALHFAGNAVNIGSTVILHYATSALVEHLHSHGFTVIQTPLGEFMKAGGAAKCLTLRLNEPRL